MKLMISGGYDEAAAGSDNDNRIVQFAEALARQVIKQGHELRCANLSSLDAIVIEAACDEAEDASLDPEQAVVSYVPLGQQARVGCGQVNDSAIADWNSMSGRKPSVPEPIDQADAVILIGGFGNATGTYTAANWARQAGTPILPVATFGLAARDIYDDLPNGPDCRKETGLIDEDLSKLTRNASTLDDDAKIKSYARQVVTLAERAALSRVVFVIMSFEQNETFRDYQAAVEAVCEAAGFEAVRTDSRPAANADQIIDAIHDHIESCGFVIADLTNTRPNVYYEIGYARGLNKKLILTSQEGTDVNFNLQGYNRIEWSGSENLKDQLRPVVEEIAISFGLSHR